MAGFQTGSLGIIVVTVGIVFGNVLQNHAPVAFNIDSALNFGVVDVGGAKVALGTDPVGGVIRRRALK